MTAAAWFVFVSALVVLSGAAALVVWRARTYSADGRALPEPKTDRTHYATPYRQLGIEPHQPRELGGEVQAESTEFMSLAEMGFERAPEAEPDGTQLIDMVAVMPSRPGRSDSREPGPSRDR